MRLALVGVAALAGAAVLAQSRPATDGPATQTSPDDAGMSNEPMTADPDAELRAAQATVNVAHRIETLALPGTTVIQQQAGGHRADVSVDTRVMSSGNDDAVQIGSRTGGTIDHLLSTMTIRVDGCEVALPWPRPGGFADPRSLELTHDRGGWLLRIGGSEGDESYEVLYRFDAVMVTSSHVDWGGTYLARYRSNEDDYGAGRDCTPVHPRTHGARAERAAAPAPA